MRVFFILSVTFGFAHFGTAQNDCTNYFNENTENCCQDCTCRYCWTVGCCQDSPTYLEENCTFVSVCGNGEGETDCTDFAQQNNNGGVCIPIDGGLGFLIAGGLGMGVVGVRRRQSLELVSD